MRSILDAGLGKLQPAGSRNSSAAQGEDQGTGNTCSGAQQYFIYCRWCNTTAGFSHLPKSHLAAEDCLGMESAMGVCVCLYARGLVGRKPFYGTKSWGLHALGAYECLK